MILNKTTYVIINIIGLTIALLLLIFGPFYSKILGLVGIIIIAKEWSSGRYKKYVKEK